jgi:hypothetical protein
MQPIGPGSRVFGHSLGILRANKPERKNLQLRDNRAHEPDNGERSKEWPHNKHPPKPIREPAMQIDSPNHPWPDPSPLRKSNRNQDDAEGRQRRSDGEDQDVRSIFQVGSSLEQRNWLHKTSFSPKGATTLG